jgi:hypothetical protein
MSQHLFKNPYMRKQISYILGIYICLQHVACISENKQSVLNNSICDTSAVTYTNTVRPLMTSYCISCHNSSSPSAGVNLEGYSNVKNYVDNGQLWGTMNHSNGFSPMPKGTPKLDACSLSKLLAWINKGALNN